MLSWNVKRARILFLVVSVSFCSLPVQRLCAVSVRDSGDRNAVDDGTVVKKVLDLRYAGENLLDPNAWRPWQKGFGHHDNIFICDNGSDSQVQRGISQNVVLNQTKPEPVIATAWSKAENVGGGRNSDYSLYLDLLYSDGTPLWGQVDQYSVGSHDWEKAQVVVFPEKPVKSVSFHMLLRQHTGKALFRDPQLRVIRPPTGSIMVRAQY